MKAPDVIINQVNTLVLNRSLTLALQFAPDKIYPFYMDFNGDCVKVHIVNENCFTGCWFAVDRYKSGGYRFKAARGEALAVMFKTHGFKPLTNYKVVDIIPKYGFTITKEEL